MSEYYTISFNRKHGNLHSQIVEHLRDEPDIRFTQFLMHLIKVGWETTEKRSFSLKTIKEFNDRCLRDSPPWDDLSNSLITQITT